MQRFRREPAVKVIFDKNLKLPLVEGISRVQAENVFQQMGLGFVDFYVTRAGFRSVQIVVEVEIV